LKRFARVLPTITLILSVLMGFHSGISLSQRFTVDREGGNAMSQTKVSEMPGRSPGVGRGAIATLAIASFIALIFVGVVAMPYFALNETQFGTYWPRRGWLILHIATGVVALFTGPIQIWLGLSDRNVGLHRRLGVIYMSAVVVSSFAAYYLAFHTDGGWVFGAGLVGLAT